MTDNLALAKRFDWEPGSERNYPSPPIPLSFVSQLKEATKNCDIELRLRWAPDVPKYEIDRLGNVRMGKQYAVLPKVIQNGWFIGDIVNLQFVLERHSAPGEICRGRPVDETKNVYLDSQGKVWLRDSYVEEIAFPRWVLEQKIDGQLARAIHGRERWEWVHPETGMRCREQDLRGWEWVNPHNGDSLSDELAAELRSLGVEPMRRTYDPVIPVRRDMLGEFPAEGWWKCFLVIAEHLPDDKCCGSRWPLPCHGIDYRDPDSRDLDEVKLAIWFREQEPKLRGKAEPPTAWELREYERRTMAEIAESEARADKQVEEMLLEACHVPYSVPEIGYADVGAAHAAAQTD